MHKCRLPTDTLVILFKTSIANLLTPRTGYGEDNFSMDGLLGGWFGMIQAHFFLCTLFLSLLCNT